ncbi:hypothetical protein [Flavimarina sp. Hel_I_48]|uniref:hypothetical protein n=1 Tax=Flavimarina sp. Hel_I_48 TaxID=1392488 RepID=UPI0004DED737|nr:hypothetical protein [Flavimarina sp. Hel_I_48]
MKLKLVKYYDDWRFNFPKEMDKVFDEYWEAIDFLDYDENECQKRLQKIISNFSECHLDAYTHVSISYRNQKKVTQSFHYALTSYLLGKNAFPKEFDEKNDRIIWSNMDNRPFLRACQNLGLEYQYRKDFSRTIELYRENLSYNENDNQGIRYLLLECYLELKDYKEFKNLLDKYDGDYIVEFFYGRVIYDILKNNGKEAMDLLTEAAKCNKHVVMELAKEKHIEPDPHRIPGAPNFNAGIPIGSIQQAYDYWSTNKKTLNLKIIRDFFKYAKKNNA